MSMRYVDDEMRLGWLVIKLTIILIATFPHEHCTAYNQQGRRDSTARSKKTFQTFCGNPE